MTVSVRDANGDDIAAVHAIYSHHVLHGFGTFDEEPPPLGDYTAKWRDILAMGLPWLVAVEGGEVVGFAYASPFRPRTGTATRLRTPSTFATTGGDVALERHC